MCLGEMQRVFLEEEIRKLLKNQLVMSQQESPYNHGHEGEALQGRENAYRRFIDSKARGLPKTYASLFESIGLSHEGRRDI